MTSNLRRRWALLALMSAVAAGIVVVAVSLIAGDGPFIAVGTDDPGLVVRLLDPLARLVLDAAATVCVGALVFAAFFTRAQPSGLISPPALPALQTAGRAAWVWAAAALLLWPVDVAAYVGLPLHEVLTLHGMVGVTRVMEQPKAWLTTFAAAVALAVACRLTLRHRKTYVLVGLGIFALLPVVTAGHSASDTGHDLATTAIAIHIPAAVIWLGSLIALVRSRGLGAERPEAERRYARLATACWFVVAFSGLVDAAVLAPGDSVLTTGFGGLLIAKAVILLLLGGALTWLRRRRFRPVVELVALALSFGASVGLTHLIAPKFVGRVVTAQDTLLGYDLSGPLTAARLLTDWRLEVLFTPLSVLLAVLYLLTVRRRSAPWPVLRTVSWLSGCAVLLIATSSGLGRYAPAMFSVQAATHMLIGMLAPFLLALGDPLGLLGRTVRLTPRPVLATVLFLGLPFLLYFTDVYDVTARFHWAHVTMDLVFLAVGYHFARTVIDGDAPALLRLGLILVAMPFDLLFAAGILASRHIIGNGAASANLYRALDLPWVPSLAADQRLGGYLALGISEAIMLFALAVVVLRWKPAAPDDDYRQILDTMARHRTVLSAAAGPDDSAGVTPPVGGGAAG